MLGMKLRCRMHEESHCNDDVIIMALEDAIFVWQMIQRKVVMVLILIQQ